MNLEEVIQLRTIEREGVGCGQRGAGVGGQELSNRSKLNRRGTCFPADEETNRFSTKSNMNYSFNSSDILKIIEVILGNW